MQPPRRPSLCLNLRESELAFPCSRNFKTYLTLCERSRASFLAQAQADKNLGFFMSQSPTSGIGAQQCDPRRLPHTHKHSENTEKVKGCNYHKHCAKAVVSFTASSSSEQQSILES
eukprot:1417859-Pleurochrysis_carterae.AAC.1